MVMKIFIVDEGSTGILKLTDQDKNVTIFQPDCDLDKVKDYLYEFYNMETSLDLVVKNSFFYDAILAIFL